MRVSGGRMAPPPPPTAGARARLWTVCVLAALAAGAPAAARGRSIASRPEERPKDCEWERYSAAEVAAATATANDEDGSALLLGCRLRTIGGTGGLLRNVSAALAERITALRLVCSDVLFFESSLDADVGSFLAPLRRLRDLRVEFCKIRHVPGGVLAAARALRHLSLRTHNTDWSAMTLEFDPDSFRGLGELRSLSLADNNIWALPKDLFCPLFSLAALNLTRNRLQDVSDLGFSDWGGGPTAPGKACNAGLEMLDLSANDIGGVPDNALSGLRSLRRLYLQDNAIAALADRALVGLQVLQLLNASSNQLVALPPELFQSTRDIKEVYLQNNSISVLAPGLLEGLEELQVLDLSDNELTSNWVNRDTFSGMIRLVVLNLAHNRIAKIDAHVFEDLNNLQILNLDHNNIDVVAEGAFSALRNLHALTLSHNALVQLEPYHFAGLFVLNQLFLSSNRIRDIHPRAFENCTNLQDLGLSGNALTEVPRAVRSLVYLKSLDLGENIITHVSNVSFEGLQQLYGLRLIDNALTNVSRAAFAPLQSLQILNLARNRIAHVETSAFAANPTLHALRLDGNRLADVGGALADMSALIWLNISDNGVRRFDYALLPRSLEWLDMHRNLVSDLADKFGARASLQLKMLDASFNRLTVVDEASLPDSVESVFLNDNLIVTVKANTFARKSNLSRVVLYANQMERLDLAALHLQPVAEGRELPQFYVGGNPFYCDCSMEWLQRINQMGYLGLRQYPRVMDLDSVRCRLAHSRGAGPRPLLDLRPSQFLCPYDSHCFALCHCCDFDACDCEMTCPDNCTCFHDHTWAANVVDCSNSGHTSVPAKIPMDATEIYLDGNELGELGSHVFIGKKKLQVLYLNSSNIAAIHNRTFNGVTSLRVLHLENNKLQELRGFEFDQLQNLNELYLDHNAITHVGNTTFSVMSNLEVLRLDDNKISDMAPWQLAAGGGRARVSLEGNEWTCNCESARQYEAWAREAGSTAAAEKVTCSGRGGERQTLAEVVRRCGGGAGPGGAGKDGADGAVATSVVQKSPFFNSSLLAGDYVPLLAAALAVVVLVLALGALAFAFRQDVRLWAHARYGVRILWDPAQGTELDDDRDRLYDGYMVYSLRDEDFVSRCVASELEQSGYSLCLHYRDLPLVAGASSYLADSVLGATDASRRVLVVLSLSLLQSEWSRPEFRSAVQAALQQSRLALRRSKVIFVLTTDPGALNLDPDLQLLLRTCTVVSWGEKRFWEKLRYAMPDVPPLKKKKKKCGAGGVKSAPAPAAELKKGGGGHRAASARYTAAPTSLDAWYKYAAMAPAPGPQPQQLPPPPPCVPQPLPPPAGVCGAPGGVCGGGGGPGAPLATPTPTQSTYVSENSSQRVTDPEEDEEEEDGGVSPADSQHYEYAAARGGPGKHNYVAIDARPPPPPHHPHHPHYQHKGGGGCGARPNGHVYSSIPETQLGPPAAVASAAAPHLHGNEAATMLDAYPAASCRMNCVSAANGVLPCHQANGRTYFV